MKNLLLITLFLSLNVMANPVVTNIFAPKGFDSNDAVEVVVTGILPNLCYRNAKVHHAKTANEIKILVSADFESTKLCPEVLVPFNKTINLGQLEAGEYTLIYNDSMRMKPIVKSFFVSAAKSKNVDDFQYAKIKSVQRELLTRVVKIEGVLTADCLEPNGLKVISNDDNSYSILPLVKVVSKDCHYVVNPLEYEFEVPVNKMMKEEEILIHVRSMDGSSVNYLFSNRM